MKGNLYRINILENSRYFVVTTNNVTEVTQLISVFAGSNQPELTVPFPYTDLIDKLKQKFTINDDPSASAVQQYRNHLSALNGYLVFCGKTDDSNVGSELSGQFETKLKSYLDSTTLAPRTRRDRTQQLNAIKKLYQATLAGLKSPMEKTGTLAETLRLRIAETGVPPKTLAKQAEVDPTTLWHWLRGTTPRADTLASLRRLEVRLSLERDSLVRLIEKSPSEKLKPTTIPAHRLHVAARQKQRLALPESALTAEFKNEWSALFDYKISSFPTLERQSKGHWRLIPKNVSVSVSPLAQRGSMVCPTADMFADRMRLFLGVLTNLRAEVGGIAWVKTPPQTLSWCAHPQALECFLQWMTIQSDGIRHNGQKVFASAVASLLRPNTGFLWQQASVFRERLPHPFQPESEEAWRTMCAKSHKLLRDYIRSSTGISRNPEEPIADLLALPNPLQPVRDAIARIQADAAAAPPGSISEARHKRNALILVRIPIVRDRSVQFDVITSSDSY